jgi:uncharacterized protein
MENKKRKLNHLAGQASPYLLQHADNPVDWYPWGEEAFERAKKEDKPVFLSIGYSACHWCHVMAHESFENQEIADYINANFISIKVDREERPDVDHIYMQAVQAMTGRGGWPLSVFLAPDGKPFFGGTYFPPENSHGMPGFTYILGAMKQAYAENKLDIQQQAQELQAALSVAPDSIAMAPTAEILDQAYGKICAEIDCTYGGFGTAPKFPEPMAMEFLLRMYKRNNDKKALEAVELALEKMAAGGVYDQLGGGFHRYSTDNMWRVPHFEKMLYDNALLSSLYVHAYQSTKKEVYATIACATLDFLLREMRAPGGGFYSALDADSEGIEGKYYLWSRAEIERAVGVETADRVCEYYHVTAKGNFEGSNVLYAADPDEGLPIDVKKAMLAARENRVKPGRDEKVIASWNGMVISSLAEAGAACGRSDFIEAANSCASFVTDVMMRQGRLVHTFKDGTAGPNGFLEDYACVIQALLDLHAVTLSIKWLDLAVKLANDVIDLFLDKTDGFLYDCARDSEKLFLRPRNIVDGATPCGSSATVRAFQYLASAAGDQSYEKVAEKAFESVQKQMAAFPRGFGNWLCALDLSLSTPLEIVIFGGNDKEESRKAVNLVCSHYLPNKVMVGSSTGGQHRISLLENRSAIDGHTTTYICLNKTCRQPIIGLDGMGRALNDLDA